MVLQRCYIAVSNRDSKGLVSIAEAHLVFEVSVVATYGGTEVVDGFLYSAIDEVLT